MFRAHRYFPALLLVAGVAVATPACAEQTYGYGYPTRGVLRPGHRAARLRQRLSRGCSSRDRTTRGETASFSTRESQRVSRRRRRATARNDGDRSILPADHYRQGFQIGYSESVQPYRALERLRQPGRRAIAARVVTPRVRRRRRRLCGAGRLPRRLRSRARRRARPQPLRPGPGQALPRRRPRLQQPLRHRATSTSATTARRSSRDIARDTARR